MHRVWYLSRRVRDKKRNTVHQEYIRSSCQILEKIERNRHRPASVAEQCDSDSVKSRGKVGEAWDEHPRLV